MLTQSQYDAQRRALDRQIEAAQQAFDAASLEAINGDSSGRHTEALQRLTELRGKREALHAAWRAASAQLVASLTHEDSAERDAAFEQVQFVIHKAIATGAELRTVAARCGELRATLCNANDEILQALRPFARTAHSRDEIGILPDLVTDAELDIDELLAGEIDLRTRLSRRGERLRQRIQRFLWPDAIKPEVEVSV